LLERSNRGEINLTTAKACREMLASGQTASVIITARGLTQI